MTCALDGTYWRVNKGGKYDPWTRDSEGYIEEFDTLADAKARAKQVIACRPERAPCKIVRIRPRMSITKAVRLLTEARKHGVELWMRKVGGVAWVHLEGHAFFRERTGITYQLYGDGVLARWIVATPEDARKIDKRGGSWRNSILSK